MELNPHRLAEAWTSEPARAAAGSGTVIASIEDPPVIERILNYLAGKDLPVLWPDSRTPPPTSLR